MVMVWHLNIHYVLAMSLAKIYNVTITWIIMHAMKFIGKEMFKMHWKKENNCQFVQPSCVDIVSFHQFALQGAWLECTMYCIIPKPWHKLACTLGPMNIHVKGWKCGFRTLPSSRRQCQRNKSNFSLFLIKITIIY